MNQDKITDDKLAGADRLFKELNCCQTVFGIFAPELGLDQNTALKIASGFGGGMGCAATCGAVTGAYMVIGYKHGNATGNPEKKAHTKSLIKKFNDKFRAEYGTLICRELTGFDISDPNEAMAANKADVFSEKCPRFIKTACLILEKDF